MNPNKNNGVPSKRSDENEVDPLFIQLDELFPAVFVGQEIGRLSALGLFIPIVIAMIAQSKLTPMPVWFADIAVHYLGTVWYGLSVSYESLKESGQLHQATTLVLYFILEFMFFVFVFGAVIRQYCRRRKDIKTPDVVIDGATILVGVVLYILLSKKNIATEQSSFGGLFLDAYGFYYFKQYMIFWACVLAPLILLISIVKMFDRSGKTSK